MQVPADGPFSERPETAIEDFEAMLEIYQEAPTSYEAFMLGVPPQL